MECLVNLVGVSSSVGVSDSGLYLNTLENINIQSVSKIADEDQEDVLTVFRDIEARSINRFRTLFIIELNGCYRISNRERAECLICSNKELLSVAFQYLMATELMTERITSSRVNKYTTIDKITAQRSRIEFEERMMQELHVAVLGIDIEGSDCFAQEEAPDHVNIITVIESTP